MVSYFNKLNNLLRLAFVKLKYPSHVYFKWVRCWNIRIRSGFEIQQFPLAGRLRVVLARNVTIEKDVWIRGSSRLTIGQGTYIGRRAVIGCNEKVTIGQDCLLAENVRIQDTDHNFSNVSIPVNQQGITTAPVTIGNDVWIGFGVVITKGVTIGDGCVIGANSVVTRDIPPYSVAVGVPARVIKKRGE